LARNQKLTSATQPAVHLCLSLHGFRRRVLHGTDASIAGLLRGHALRFSRARLANAAAPSVDRPRQLPPAAELWSLCWVAEPKRLSERVHGPNPLPIETVRDLLGIVRVLYALHRRQGNQGNARELQQAGRKLRRALELAIRNGDAAAHSEAWRLATEAIDVIGQVQRRSHEDLAVAVRLATERVATKHYQPLDREAKRAARIKRG
jgi:hypothetical protein